MAAKIQSTEETYIAAPIPEQEIVPPAVSLPAETATLFLQAIERAPGPTEEMLELFRQVQAGR